MPILLTLVKTPKGRSVARSEFVPEVTVDEATRFLSESTTAEYAPLPFLVCGSVSSVSADVRKVLSSAPKLEQPQPVAIVLTSVVARAVAGLMLRNGNNSKSAYFKNETEALEWLDTVS